MKIKVTINTQYAMDISKPSRGVKIKVSDNQHSVCNGDH